MTKFTKEKVLLLHQYIAAETGGSVGVRDEGLLESALQSAFATFDGRELYPTKEEKAARIGASLVANHSFLDGNKGIGGYHPYGQVLRRCSYGRYCHCADKKYFCKQFIHS